MLELAKPVESVEKHKEVATVKLLLWVACKKLWASEKVKFLKLLADGIHFRILAADLFVDNIKTTFLTRY